LLKHHGSSCGPLDVTRALVRIAFALVCIAAVAPPVRALAADAPRVVAIGESNDAAERAELLAFFGATADSRLVPVTVDETLSATGKGFDLSGVDTAYSSAAITCSLAGTGVAVVTRNIEVVPPALYALALVTAGITDVQLAVGAPDADPALGMTALAGVFKAWDAAPCGAGGGDVGRRQLALDEVAFVARVGRAQDGEHGVRAVTGAMQDAQMRVVVDGADPEQAFAAAAGRADLNLAAADLADGAAFLNQLAGAGIEWHGFARGWALAPTSGGGGAHISPIGRHAEPTVAAAVSTGVGGLVSTVVPTPQSTSTATPLPTATATATIAAAGLIHVQGTLQNADDNHLTLLPDGADQPTDLAIADGAAITRIGRSAQPTDLRPGDRVTGTMGAGDHLIVTLDATPKPAAGRGSLLSGRLAAALALMLLALLALFMLLARRRRRPHVSFGRVSPVVAAAAVARRRAEASVGAVRNAMPTAPRRFSVRRHLADRTRAGGAQAAKQ